MNEGLKVLKRDNKKVDFNGEKIAIAIKKAFDSREEFILKYTDEDVNKVYTTVLEDIHNNYFEESYIKVEEIQDVIEKQLLRLEYNEIYESFSNYRDKRAESRKMFLSEPKQHKLLKAIERLTIKQDSIKSNNETQMEVIFNYGKIISEEFANAYFLNNKFNSLHESGQIYINNLEYLPMGMVESLVIPYDKLLEKGFKDYNTPTNIESCMSLLLLIIKKTLEDISEDVGLFNLDYNLVPFIVKTFKEELIQKVYEFLDLDGFLNLIDYDAMVREINKIENITFDKEVLYKYSKEVKKINLLLDKAYEYSVISTEKRVFNSIYNFLHNSCFKVGDKHRNITIDLGLDTSYEGRILIKSYLKSLDYTTNVKTIFKLKDNINYNKNALNYDLYLLSLDKNLNYSYDKENIFYFYDGIKIFRNINSDDNSYIGRGILSKTYINLTRIAIKIKNGKGVKESFLLELDEILDMVKEQLLERFDIQSNKRSNEFPFIMGETLYMDSKGLKSLEKVKKALKNGLLAIGIIGLNECSEYLELNKKDIINFIVKKIDKLKKETQLNFVLIGPNEDISKKFINLDRTIYGEINGITNKDCYDLNIDDELIESFDGGFCYKIKNNKNLESSLSKGYKYISIKKEVSE